MNPHLHHVRVFGFWALRQPFVAFMGGSALALTAVGVGGFGGSEGAITQAIGAFWSAVFLGSQVGIFGMIAGAAVRPSSAGFEVAAAPSVLPMLPVHPGARALLEAVGATLGWALLVVPATWLCTQLPESENLLVYGVRLLGTWAWGGLPAALLIPLPALVVGRKQCTMGQPSALGTMLLAVALCTPLVAFAEVLPILLVASVTMAGVADRLTPEVERWSGVGIERLSRLAPGIAGSEQPWHSRRGYLLRRVWVTAAPGVLLVSLPLTLMGSAGNSPGSRLLFHGLMAMVLLGGPMLTPLALNGRTVGPGGRGVALDGTFAEAWRFLPVEPRVLRRAALTQSAIGAGLALTLLLGAWLWGTQAGLDLPDATSLALAVLGLLAAIPAATALTLGDGRQRGRAMRVLQALAVALFGSILLHRWVDERLVTGIVALLLLGSVAGSLHMARDLLRPLDHEVRGR